MTATHELVVPKSIPITSPASALLNLFGMSRLDTPIDDLAVALAVKDAAVRRNPICSAIVLMVGNFETEK